MIKRKFQLTAGLLEEIRAAFEYQPDTGVLRWISPDCTNISAGYIAGRKHSNGHIEVKFKHVSYMAHHIAWFLHYGKWPNTRIQHVNGNKADNRIANMEEILCSSV